MTDKKDKKSKEEMQKEINKYGSISKHPDKKEVLFLASLDDEGKSNAIIIPFTKKRNLKKLLKKEIIFEKEVDNGSKGGGLIEMPLLKKFWDGYFLTSN